FFQESMGKWQSQRRYYTLPEGETKEMESIVTINFLEQGCDELQKLAQMHDLSDTDSLICGAAVTWESRDVLKATKESQGSTLFGVMGNI
ncbi:MAG: phycobiliprotein lyase, partial [Nostoc sp.]